MVEFPDTAAYIFNFGEDDGYAIISADTRIDAPILAYAGGGSLHEETDNPGLGLFLEGAEGYIMRSIVEAEQRRDSLINDIIAKLDDRIDPETKSLSDLMKDIKKQIRVTTTTTPLMTTAKVAPLSPVEWGQGDANNEPFWRNVRYKNCSAGRSPAGCVAIATAHIMSYWKYPTDYNWYLLNQYTAIPSLTRLKNHKGWSGDITKAPPSVQAQVANLIECIGCNVKMSYGCGSSSADADDAIKYLRSLGYLGGGKYDYNYDWIRSSLYNKRPVFMGGNSSRTSHKFLGITWYTYDEGHAWVVDGYLEQIQAVTTKMELVDNNGKTTLLSTSTSLNNVKYLHHNWGWNGHHNGYYVAGSFNTNEEPRPSDTKSGESGNYQYSIDTYLNICR